MAAVESCVENGANIISMSLGGGGYSSSENSFYQTAYQDDNVLIIAAGTCFAVKQDAKIDQQY